MEINSGKKSTSRPTSNFMTKNAPTVRVKKDVKPYVSKYPFIDYAAIKLVPNITVSIKFEQDRADNVLELKIPSNLTLRKVIEKVNERHSYSCHNIRIFIRENTQKKYMDDLINKTFQELKISSTENLNLFYEYDPVEHPILQA